jgi:hypothetical protein
MTVQQFGTGAPSSHALRCYCMTRRLQVHIVKVPSSRWRRLWQRGFERLEPCAVKVACRVLRGGCGGNVASLPDSAHFLAVRTKNRLQIIAFRISQVRENR